MWTISLIVVYCLLIMCASLLGGWLPSVVRFTHTRMQLMMSFVAGLMMGVALLHMLPHAAAESGSLDHASMSAVAGLLAMFFAIRIFHVHGHEPHESLCEEGQHECDHPPGHCHDHPTVHELSWLGLFGGLAIHTLIDGVALAASVAANADPSSTGLIGLGTFVAVVMHKPLDALSITSIMLAGGWSIRSRRIVNVVFSLMCPAGAIAFFLAVGRLGDATQQAVGWSLAFAAGAFLCISLADVLPEVQFHRHDRLKLSTALILGVVLAWSIGFCEPGHSHSEPGHSHSEPGHEHSEPGHEHGAAAVEPHP